MRRLHGLRYSESSEQAKGKEVQTVTHAVVQEVINNTGLSWVNAVAWCDNNLPLWRTSEPVTAEVIEVIEVMESCERDDE